MVVIDTCSWKFLTLLALFLAALVEFKLHVVSFATVNPEEAFNGRNAVIVGASQGIGRALAIYLAKHGANVVAVARQEKKLTSLALETEGFKGQVIPVAADAASKEASKILLNAISKDLEGRLDYVFLNHASFYGAWTHFLDYEEETWTQGVERMYQVNVHSFMRLTRAFTPLLSASKGSLVVTGSVAAVMGVPGHSTYGSTKAALWSFCKSLRLEYIIKGLDISVAYAVVGNVMVERRLHNEKDFASKFRYFFASEERAARDIAHGAYRRVKVISTPVWEVAIFRAWYALFSESYDFLSTKIMP